MRKAHRIIRLVAAALLVAGCGKATAARNSDPEVIARVTSPDSVLDAVATVNSVDATTPNVVRVYLVPRGGQAPYTSENFRADHVDGLKLEWSTQRQLHIRYATARIFQFVNFWNSREVEDFRYQVELRLAPDRPVSLPERSFPGEGFDTTTRAP